MRLATMTMLMMTATCCFAGDATYEIAIDFSADGQLVASPKVLVESGVKQTVDVDGRYIDVLASEKADDGRIVLSFWVGKVDGGTRKLLATPSAVVVVGRQIVLKVLVEDPTAGMREMALAVTAVKKSG
jgi:hypothetical protein